LNDVSKRLPAVHFPLFSLFIVTFFFLFLVFIPFSKCCVIKPKLAHCNPYLDVAANATGEGSHLILSMFSHPNSLCFLSSHALKLSTSRMWYPSGCGSRFRSGDIPLRTSKHKSVVTWCAQQSGQDAGGKFPAWSMSLRSGWRLASMGTARTHPYAICGRHRQATETDVGKSEDAPL
jgi:hypothetical protein